MLSHLLSSRGGLPDTLTTGGNKMFHKHKYNTDETLESFNYLIGELSVSIGALVKDIKELREEVDYLADLLDD